MEDKVFSFNSFNNYAEDGISEALKNINDKNSKPIIICVGSDLVLGDSLGPLVGTLLKQKGCGAYIYGTLNAPITAKEVEYAKIYIKQTHPLSKLIAIDAAVGDEEDVGIVKVLNKGLKPGLGVNKNLGVLGDQSIIGVVASKSIQNYNLFNLTRLNLIYKMSEIIASGLHQYLSTFNQNTLNKNII
jgi:putative sporulation protein YyaC